MNPASALELARPNWANLHVYKKGKNSTPVQKEYRGNINSKWTTNSDGPGQWLKEQVQPHHYNKTQLSKNLKDSAAQASEI